MLGGASSGTCWLCSLSLCLFSLLKLSWERDRARTFCSFESWITPPIPNIGRPRENHWVLHAQATLHFCLWLIVVIFSQSSSPALPFLSCFFGPDPLFPLTSTCRKTWISLTSALIRTHFMLVSHFAGLGCGFCFCICLTIPEFFLLDLFSIPETFLVIAGVACLFLGGVIVKVASVIYLELKKTDIKLKWVLVHVRECDGRPCLCLAYQFVWYVTGT